MTDLEKKLKDLGEEAKRKGFDQPPPKTNGKKLTVSDFETLIKVSRKAKKDRDRTVDTVVRQLEETDNILPKISRPLVQEVFDRKRDIPNSKAGKLLRLIEDIEFYKDDAGEAWCIIDGEFIKVDSTKFKRYLQREFLYEYDDTPYSQALKDVIDQAEARAFFEGKTVNVPIRVAKVDGKIIVDHITDTVTIDKDGWHVGSDVSFYRPKGMKPLPMPSEDEADVMRVEKYLNAKNKRVVRLKISALTSWLNPDIASPIVINQGESGTAKSTDARMLRSVIDPSVVALGTPPRNERDLAIDANKSGIICLDNLSGCPPWLSDALCRICTGTAFTTRKLHTDEGRKILQMQKDIILNGIDDVATRGDLRNRSMVFTLPKIDQSDKIEEDKLNKQFRKDHPVILAGLYDAISAGLRADDPKIGQLPRMADYMKWVTKCETGLPWDAGTLIDDFNKNQKNAIEAGLDGDYLAVAIREILSNTGWYKAEPTVFVEKLRSVSSESNKQYMPTVRTLKKRLRRLGDSLRAIGINWDYQKSTRREYIIYKDGANLPDDFGTGNDNVDEAPF
jgi:hypothetical protein